jgi:hypothetical protein
LQLFPTPGKARGLESVTTGTVHDYLMEMCFHRTLSKFITECGAAAGVDFNSQDKFWLDDLGVQARAVTLS